MKHKTMVQNLYYGERPINQHEINCNFLSLLLNILSFIFMETLPILYTTKRQVTI